MINKIKINHKFFILILIVLSISILPKFAMSQSSCSTVGSNTFFACYYDNQDFTGTLITRTDSTINFDWGDGSPDPSIGEDSFSAKWTGDFNFSSGTYTFTATADDGVRVYVDNVLKIDEWIDQGATTYTADVDMSSGTHRIKVEYYENGGGAVAQVSWTKVSSSSGGPTDAIAWWELDESGGGTASDSSGNGHDGALQNGPTFTSGQFGNALQFDGGDDYVSGSGVNIANGPYSISAWVKTNSSGSEQYFSIGSNPDTDQTIHLRLTSNTSMTFGQYNDDIDATLNDISDRWTNIVVTMDGSKVRKIYQDGVLITSNSASNFFTGDNNWHIGNWVASGDEQFNGSIDDVRVYNRALSSSEVQAIYNSVPSSGSCTINSFTADNSSPTYNTGTNLRFSLSGSFNWSIGLLSGTVQPTPTSGSGNGGSVSTGNLISNQTYRLTCGSQIQDVTVTPSYPSAHATPAPVYMIPNSLTDTTRETNYLTYLQNTITVSGFSDEIMIDQKQYQKWSLGNQPVILEVTFLGAKSLQSGYSNVFGYYPNGDTSQFVPLFKLSGVSDFPGLTVLSPGQKITVNLSALSTISFGLWNHSPIGNSSTENSKNADGQDHALVYDAYSVSNIPSNGLVGHWKFDEGSGTSASDLSGNGHNGTLINGASFTSSGKVGGGLSLSGGGQAVKVPGLLNSPSSVTLSGWANLTSPDTLGAYIVSIGNYDIIKLDAFDSDKYASGKYYNGAGWNATKYYATYAGTGWHHFAYTNDNNNHVQNFYVDGSLVATTNYNDSSTHLGQNPDTYFGSWGAGFSGFDFIGTIDDVRVYNRPLTAQEILSLYQYIGVDSTSSLPDDYIVSLGSAASLSDQDDVIVKVKVIPPVTPSETLSATTPTVSAPQTSHVTWTTTNVPTSCNATSNPSLLSWNGPKDINGGNQDVININTTTTLTLTCSNTAGSSSISTSVSPNLSGLYSVNVTKTTGGSVKSADNNINCGSVCSSSYFLNSTVTLQAYPDSAYWKFTGWTGDCSGTGACVLNINSQKNVSAVFAPPQFKYQEF